MDAYFYLKKIASGSVVEHQGFEIELIFIIILF